MNVHSKDMEAAMDHFLQGLKSDPAVLQMKQYTQHGHTTTYEHCENVARISCVLNQRFHLHADEQALLRGALLHDFYLYDWHDHSADHRLHGFRHPAKAAENAARCFHINRKEREIIECHMWPLTISRIPKCREAWIVCLADKYCALMETLCLR